MVLSLTSFRTSFSRISAAPAQSYDLIESLVSLTVLRLSESRVRTLEPPNPFMTVYSLPDGRELQFLQCFARVNINWALTAFITLTY